MAAVETAHRAATAAGYATMVGMEVAVAVAGAVKEAAAAAVAPV